MNAPPVHDRRIGLLAGWGRLPIVIAEELKRQDCSVYCLGVKDHADPLLRQLCDAYQEIGVARFGAAIRFFRRHRVARATMAGKLHKTLFFQKFAWLKHLPDWTGLVTFYPHFITGTKDRRDDTLLGAIVETFARHGISFVPATDLAPELLVSHGTLARRPVTSSEQKDIEFGWHLAKEMGRLDIGQSVVVQGRAVLAVEAIEGTDECIRRAGRLCPQGGFTVVKVAKPQQDMRFDVPTVGVGTIRTIAEAGGRVLAIEAEKTILIDREEVLALANQFGISLVALREGTAGFGQNTPGGQSHAA